MVYLTQKEKNYVVRKTNEVGLCLFEFYLSKSGTPDYEFADDKTATAIEWSIRKVRDNRQALQKANLYRTEKDKIATITTIGQAIILHKEYSRDVAALNKLLDKVSTEEFEKLSEELKLKYAEFL